MHAGRKFSDPEITLSGERRATVRLIQLETLWFNTGTLCNLACDNCYIGSNPHNDRLAYLSRGEVRHFLDAARLLRPVPEEIGFTGGEPFMNRDILGMIEDSLDAGFHVLVLTNAMQPMQRLKSSLTALRGRYPGKLTVRVSLDHYDSVHHEKLRGAESWAPTIAGLVWLARSGFDIAVAGRMVWDESENQVRAGFAKMFADLGVNLDADDPGRLVLFPEMQQECDVAEITENCWGILGKSPASVMCANSRMVIRRKEAPRPSVVACTLLPYDDAFEMGTTLAEATSQPVSLNHPFCAQFCVLGGASCSVRN